ncbi:calcium-binding protein [Gemmata sp.]|uniref:calcium-binding protein n=1 Tax=Gemmata sp. TaxID=1914242 RepID=UPI003F72306C
MRSRSPFVPRIETLGGRALPSVTLTDGFLDVEGTTGPDEIRVTLASPEALQVTIDSTGEARQFPLAGVRDILIRAKAGDDVVVIGPGVTVPAEVRGWAGYDTILGGGGDDTILGGGGNDYIQGRGGDDRIFGQAGDDYLLGQGGNDAIDGQAGSDLLAGGGGINTLTNGTDIEFTFLAPLPGGVGSVALATDGMNFLGKTFTATATNAAPNASADVSVAGVPIGRLATDASGNGQFVYRVNYDADGDGLPDFLNGTPAPFPEVTPLTEVTATVTSPVQQTFTATIVDLLTWA